MILTIYFDNKSKQIIKLGDRFADRRTFGEQYIEARKIASDISNGNYLKLELHD